MNWPNNLTGVAQDAIYHEPLLDAHRGNPFIAALPPLLSREEAKELMLTRPDYDPVERQYPASEREHLASLISSIRIPTWLHGELYSRLSRLMCSGYVSRNPGRKDFQHIIDAREGLLAGADAPRTGAGPRMNGGYEIRTQLKPQSNGLTFLGTSGIGKSVAMEMVLSLWPQLLLHREYKGNPFSTIQIPWIKIDAPRDGSVNSLAERFYTTLDLIHQDAGLKSDFHRAYIKGRGRESRIPMDMARVAAQVGLGLFVLDEVQDLTPGKSRSLLSFLVQMVNVVGVPIVLVGGLDAVPLLTEQFRQTRRGSTEGDMVITQSQNGERWRDFCKSIWSYQYTTEQVEMTPAHADALFEVSQGITDFLVIAFKNAQIRAISTGKPHVTPTIIRSIRDTLNLAGPSLGAIRRNSAFVLDRLSDLSVPNSVETLPFLRGDDGIEAAAGAVGGRGSSGGKRARSKEDQAKPENPHGSGAPDRADTPVEPDRDLADDRSGTRAKAAARSTPKKRPSPARANAEEPTLVEIVEKGGEEGLSVLESLARAGAGGGELWRRVAQLPD